MQPPTPLDIERATIAAWPAALTEERDGWFYLAAGGVTGRVNAAWPLDWRGGDIEAAIDDVEAWYAARDLPPRFKLTDGAFAPHDLPKHLARRGYEAVAPTLVMTKTLTEAGDPPHDVALTAAMSATFEQALREASRDTDEFDERRAIALRAPQPAAFATIGDERAQAIGMSALAGDMAGIFLMRTVAEARRQGHARRILAALLHWASSAGAGRAFLQVDADNTPAIALYEAFGFTTLTTYRFWRKAC